MRNLLWGAEHAASFVTLFLITGYVNHAGVCGVIPIGLAAALVHGGFRAQEPPSGSLSNRLGFGGE